MPGIAIRPSAPPSRPRRCSSQRAWYCVQQQGYEVNGNRIAKPQDPAVVKEIWAAFAACEARVGVPAAHRGP